MSQFEADLEILKDESVSKEIKVNIILEMLYLEEISLRKAQELCTESGIFSKHWMNVDEETVAIHNKLYKRKKTEG